MDNAEASKLHNSVLFLFIRKTVAVFSCDGYKLKMVLCLFAGILIGCVTQAVYGREGDWTQLVVQYCNGFVPAFIAVAPMAIGLAAVMFICAPFAYLRGLIYPASVFRAMGLGALICGAVQYGSLRELCFAALILLPYSAADCVITTFAGEYTLGFKGAFTRENQGLTKGLVIHTLKMFLLYLSLDGLNCAMFAAACMYFGRHLI